MVATFARGFRHSMVWQTSGDVVLVGSDAPIGIDLSDFAARLRAPRVTRQLSQVGLEDPLSLLANLSLTDEAVRSYAREGRINTDDNLYLEFSTPHSIGGGGLRNLVSIDESRVDLRVIELGGDG